MNELTLEQKRERARQAIEELRSVLDNMPELEDPEADLQTLMDLKIDDLLPKKPFNDLTDDEIEKIKQLTDHPLLYYMRIEIRLNTFNLQEEDKANKVLSFLEKFEEKEYYDILEHALDKEGYYAELIKDALRRRTRKKAESAIATTATTILPSIQKLATITAKGYEASFSQNLMSYLDADKIKEKPPKVELKDGKISWKVKLDNDGATKEVEFKLEDVSGKPLDIPSLTFLQGVFTALMKADDDKSLNNSTVPMRGIYLPNFFKDLTKEQYNTKWKDLAKRFNMLYGKIGSDREGGLYAQAFNVSSYDPQTNVLYITTPYLEILKTKLINASKITGADGGITKDKKGNIVTKPVMTERLLLSVMTERDDGAVEMVNTIIKVITTAGNFTPNIGARRLLEENPDVLERYNSSSNKNQFLKRKFKNVLKILKEKSDLSNDYDLPDPDNPKNIPTQTTLDSIVYYFPHKKEPKAEKTDIQKLTDAIDRNTRAIEKTRKGKSK